MRTTVTLDPDVAAGLRDQMRRRGISFKEVLNESVRAGLAGAAPSRPYRTPARDLGLRPNLNLDHALRLAGEIEDTESIHKLELRK